MKVPAGLLAGPKSARSADITTKTQMLYVPISVHQRSSASNNYLSPNPQPHG